MTQDEKLNQITDFICEYFYIDTKQLRSKTRAEPYFYARACLTIIAWHELGSKLSVGQKENIISEIINRDRCTVRHCLKKPETDYTFKKEYGIILKEYQQFNKKQNGIYKYKRIGD